MTCQHLFLRGANKGKTCGKKCEGDLCNAHLTCKLGNQKLVQCTANKIDKVNCTMTRCTELTFSSHEKCHLHRKGSKKHAQPKTPPSETSEATDTTETIKSIELIPEVISE